LLNQKVLLMEHFGFFDLCDESNSTCLNQEYGLKCDN
uniref:Uncharacterized protein n=1 Tax=Panagrolaimus sp. JU765 TaxID=591449 RepID=A0AC34R2R4_9BILA